MHVERQHAESVPTPLADVDSADDSIAQAIDSNMLRLTRTPRVVVIIPAFNEERFIGSVVLKTLQHADTVIVVDDGSHDATALIAESAGAIVVRHIVNQGKGVALNSGFRRARELDPDVVVTIDADGQHVPAEMSMVIVPVIQGEADIVVGSRYLEHTSDVPAHRIIGHKVFNAISNGVSGISVTDSQSGFRAFSPRALKVPSFRSQSFSVESEMQLLARQHQLLVSEVPITITYLDAPKRSVVMQGMTVLNGIMRLTGQYRPLLFFGVPGLLLLFIGLVWGAFILGEYGTSQGVPFHYTILTTLLVTMATLSLFTGIILHSVRGLLLGLERHG